MASCPTIVTTISADNWVGGDVSTLNSNFSALQDVVCTGLNLFPTGTIMFYPANTTVVGWTPCNGRYLDASIYTSLFNILSATYGTITIVNSVTSFKLPDCRNMCYIGSGTGTGLTNRVLGETAGSESVVLTLAQIASHTHTATGTHFHTASAVHTHTVHDPHHTHTINDITHFHDVYYGLDPTSTQTQPVSNDYYTGLTTMINNPASAVPTQGQIDYGNVHASGSTSIYQERHEIGAYKYNGVLHSTVPTKYWLSTINYGGPQLMVGTPPSQSFTQQSDEGHTLVGLNQTLFDPSARTNAIVACCQNTSIPTQYVGLKGVLNGDGTLTVPERTYLRDTVLAAIAPTGTTNNYTVDPTYWNTGLDTNYRKSGNFGSLNGDPVQWDTYINIDNVNQDLIPHDVTVGGGCSQIDFTNCTNIRGIICDHMDQDVDGSNWPSDFQTEAHFLINIFRTCPSTTPPGFVTSGPYCFAFTSTSDGGGTYTPPGTTHVWNWSFTADREQVNSGNGSYWTFGAEIQIIPPAAISSTAQANITLTFTTTDTTSHGTSAAYWFDPVDAVTTAVPTQITVAPTTTNIAIQSNATGIHLTSTTIPITINQRITGITIDQSTGSGAHNNMMPNLSLIPLIKVLP